MWLIDTTTLELKQSLQPELEYAILSHTWEDGELSFQEFADLPQARKKQGFGKIAMTCKLAKNRGLKYAWVDTVCIDKTSSAELTEAINSMFRWYKNAVVCFAWISDLPSSQFSIVSEGAAWLAEREYRWFSRGWTLQELIAPLALEFYDRDWQFRGHKSDICKELEVVTGIDEEALIDSSILPEIPVARRFSWASKRKTTREEDTAYCLLGIFDIYMPMIYGEGKRAFFRLQEEVCKDANDTTLFAWTSLDQVEDSSKPSVRGLFAREPAEFANCKDLVRRDTFPSRDKAYSVTTSGIEMKALLTWNPNGEEQYVVSLECVSASTGNWQIGIYILQTGSGYIRIHPEKLFIAENLFFWASSTVHIPKFLKMHEEKRLVRELGSRIYIRHTSTESYTVQNIVAMPQALWASAENYFLTLEGVHAMSRVASTDFTGLQKFGVLYRGTPAVTCALLCGVYRDAQKRPRPFAAVFTDRDANISEEIAYAFESNDEDDEGWVLSRLWRLLNIENEAGTTSWNVLCNRVVLVTTKQGLTIRIRVSMTLVVEGDAGLISSGMFQDGMPVENIPLEYFDWSLNKEDRRYRVTVYIEEKWSQIPPTTGLTQSSWSSWVGQ